MNLNKLLLVILFLLNVFIYSDGWHHWRGNYQNGVANSYNLPATWSQQGENLLWKAPYGARTAPIVMNGHVYLINRAGKGVNLQERVVALSSETGKLVWEHRFNVFHTDIVAHRVGWANLGGDPKTGNLYAHGVQGMFFCFSKDGKILWSHSLTEEFGRISGYGGRTNTPVVDGNLVIISFLSSGWAKHARGRHRYLAMDKNTGEVIWWASPGGKPLDTTYSVPVVAYLNGIRALITGCADGALYALKVKTGETLWKYSFSKRGINSSVVVQHGRVYASHSEENLNHTAMGKIVCIDGRLRGDISKTGEIWSHYGIRIGYTSPILHGNDLLMMDNSANIHCFDAKTGKHKWKHNYGTVAKGSGVYADGKIYIGEVTGKYHILKLKADGCEKLDREEFHFPDGSPIEINGSPAVVGGKVFLPTQTDTYCIGYKRKASHLQLIPGEASIQEGNTLAYEAKLYDENGDEIGTTNAEWTVKGLNGNIDQSGLYTASQSGGMQAGLVQAKVGNLVATVRLRVLPKLPYSENFDNLKVGSVPSGWITSPLKCQVAEEDGQKLLKKMANRPSPPFARLKAYMRPPMAAGYTVQADLKGLRKKRFYPDMGLINCRYTMILLGTTFDPTLRLVSWDPMPRIQKDILFPWKVGKWYTAKLRVDIQKDGQALVRAKVWRRGATEPKEWTISLVDPSPNKEGSPGLYAYSVGITDKSKGTEVLFDNVVVKREE